MINTVSEAIRDGVKINASTWSDFLERKEKLTERTEEYSEVIQQEFTLAQNELKVLDQIMVKALGEGLIKPSRRQS